MAFDEGGSIQDAIDWAVRALQGLGTLLPILIFLIFSLFGRGKDKKSRDQPLPSRRASPQRQGEPQPQPTVSTPGFPLGPISLPTMSMTGEAPTPGAPSRQWGGAFDRDDDRALRWGSAFDDGQGGKLKWGSVFDSQAEKTKWGFDDTEWGGGFGPKRDSEPTISVG